MNENFCALKPVPRPCIKNLGIQRVNMPQINTIRDYVRLKQIIKNVLKLHSNNEQVNIHDNINASQKEINMERAKQILSFLQKKQPKQKKPQIPVILLKHPPSPTAKSNYLVVDGHHRWLAHHLAKKQKDNRTRKMKTNPLHQMKSHVIHVNKDLMESFREINDALKKDKHLFHKRHTFKAKPVKRKPRKTYKKL